MRIRDIVRRNDDAAFRSDVQLAWYPDTSENMALVKSYIFTRTSSGESKSPIEILDRIRESFVVDTQENRFMVIATFGHGKSHLALAAANYFGKPAESPEVAAILGSIRYALNNEPQAESYRDFKQNRKRNLVICLAGDRAGDLPQQFIQALEKALSEQPETQNAHLPFWFARADEYFAGLDEGYVKRANAYLAQHQMDLALLRQRITERDPQVYEIARNVTRELTRNLPDWKGEVSLADALGWTCKNFCGDGRPFSGVLVLFDEFSAFLRNYSRRTSPGAPLQDLLNGVQNHRGKAVFVAFAQSDPVAVIDSVFRSQHDPHVRESLMLEINRLPLAYRFKLYNAMETVLDAYLMHEDQNALQEAIDAGNAWPAVSDATDDCLLLFRRRYDQELRWGAERFQSVVTMGCFPLHPVTTALLCNIELLESSDPRSVLQFVFKGLDRVAERPVTAEGIPSWVYPAHLVDWFKDQLADTEWKQYQQALSDGGGDLTDDQRIALKGMLLHVVGKLPTQAVNYIKALSHLTGLPVPRAETAVKALAETNIIEYQPATRKYAFWAMGGGARIVHDRINREMAGKSLSWNHIKKANENVSLFDLSDVPVSVEWGHPNDWAAPQAFLLKEFFTPDKIREIISGNRTSVIWLVARTESDVEWFDKETQRVLDQACGQDPLPVVVMRPSSPTPDLADNFFKFCILESFSQRDSQELGRGGEVQIVKSQVKGLIKERAQSLVRTRKDYCIPQAYVAAFRAGPQVVGVEDIVRRGVEIAYANSPPAFYTQFKATSTNLKKGVRVVGQLLLQNQIHTDKHVADAIAAGLVENFLLTGKTTSWGVLTSDKRVQEPLSSRTKRAWDRLDQAIAATGRDHSVKDVLRELQRPPYGYDDNALTLLFCAWFGFHRHDLRISINNAIENVETLVTHLEDGPHDFVVMLQTKSVYIKRQDRSSANAEVRKLINQIFRLPQEPFKQSDADKVVAKLKEYLADDRNDDPADRAKTQDAAEKLTAGIEAAKAYDLDADALVRKATETASVQETVVILKRVSELRPPSGVLPKVIGVEELRGTIIQRLRDAVEKHCKKHEEMPDLTHYRESHTQLVACKRSLDGYLDLVGRVQAAIDNLETRRKEEEARQKDEAIVVGLKRITSDAPLGQLREDLAWVQKQECSSAEARSLQQQKRTALAQATKQREDFAIGLSSRIDAVNNLQAAREICKTVVGKKAHYEKTPEAKVVEDALARCEDLESFFEEVDSIRCAEFGSAVEIEQARKSLRDAAKRHANALSSVQEETVWKLDDTIQKKAGQLADDAKKWLLKAQTLVAKGQDCSSLLRLLSAPPPFLEATDIAIVEQLRGEVEAKQCSQKQEALERHRLEAEAKQKDAVVVSGLRRISLNSPLAQMREDLAWAGRQECSSQDSRSLVAQKTKGLEQEIKKLEEFAAGLDGRLSSVTRLEAIRDVYRAIVERKALYERTPEAKLVDAALARCQAMESFFRETETVKYDTFTSETEVGQARDALNDISKRHAGALSEGQRRLVKQIEEGIQKKVDQLTEEANGWLRRTEALVEKGKELDRLVQILASPPPFLQKAKLRTAERLRAEAQQRFDADESEQVICHFKRITDKEQKQKVLRELEKLLSTASE